ncbi:MAG: hypothetical protein U0414_20660 [Polyangiaceae bacterium]
MGLLCAAALVACSTTSTDGPSTGGGGGSGGGTGSDTYVQHCTSLFAARVVELAAEADASFPLDCDAPLTRAVGAVNGSDALCASGASANACAKAAFDAPPPVSSLKAGCNGAGCMRAAWVPRCRDGSDACVAADEARCVDGTRGQVYVRPGDAGSRNWIFYLDAAGSTFAGAATWVAYRFFPSLGQSDTAKTLSNLHPDAPTPASISADGLLQESGPLASYHRVAINRCGELSSDAIEATPVTDGVPEENLAAMSTDGSAALLADLPHETRRSLVDAFHRGRNVWDAMFHMLATDAGRDIDGDGKPDISTSFADADIVWIVGGSDAANWVLQGADLMADRIHVVAPHALVRVGIDSFLQGGLDNEGRYVAGASPDFNVYDDTYRVTHACGPLTLRDPYSAADVDDVPCSDANYRPGNAPSAFRDQFQRVTMEARGFIVDESCAAFHAEDVSPCYDNVHVLVHHLSTPHLLIDDRNDPKLRSGSVIYASDGRLTWRGGAPDFSTRVLDTMRDIRDHTENGQGAREEGDLPTGSTAIILRNGGDQAAHVFTGSDRIDLRMTACNGTVAGSSISIGDAFAHFDELTDRFMIEDPTDPATGYWATGNACPGAPQ